MSRRVVITGTGVVCPIGNTTKDFLYSLDNFRDGKAAFRMGEYLKTMIDLIKLNKNKNDVLLISAEKYAEKYGKDKVRTNI